MSRLPASRLVSILLLAALACPLDADVTWKEVGGTKVPVPPKEHPRLYLRPQHVAELPQRLQDPVLEPVRQRLEKLARRNEQFQLEWDAVHYLAAPDQQKGREIVEKTLQLLKKSQLPDIHDACRVTGRMMTTGAIVYDWLYPLLTDDEKQQYIAELVRLAKTQECGYPPTRQGSVTGHSSEAMIMREMISAGIAVYGEFPEMYELAAGRFFREHLPARNWLYDGHAYHQGDSYGPYRYSWDTFPLWIFDRLGAGNVYNPQQQFVPYWWIYTTRPDGQRLRAGDTFCHSAPRGQPWGVGPGAVLTASFYGDGYLLGHHEAQGGVRDNEVLFEFLWRDTKLQPKPVTDLPLSRYFGGPFGWMIARTDWGPDAVIAEMKTNVYNFTNHQHLDAGAFQLYYKGALAIDSGIYSGSSGQYGSPHCTNYYWRTIAHNCLLIYDPNEEFRSSRGYGNDGGQRLPNGRSEPRTLEVLLDPDNGYRTGTVVAHSIGPEPAKPRYTVLTSDITAAYGDKVESVVRSAVFLNLDDPKAPAALIVYDRVVAADPAFKKFWLLHTIEEPKVDGNRTLVDRTEYGQRGRMILTSLLPAADDLQIQTVGGPGREYWVFGENFANDQDPQRAERSSQEPGAWRIEISPKQPAAENRFLNVMQVTDRIDSRALPVERVQWGPLLGCRITASDADWIVLFPSGQTPLQGPLTVEVSGKQRCRILICGLKAGPWTVTPPTGDPHRGDVDPERGTAWLEGPAGRWTLTPK
ncbi:MAG: heparinase [Planctomycetaceae bacterium]|nr:heparinase [Planctomycetaceae bacterium]